jgi:two-component system sensor histidine kinase UhpB
MLPAMAKDSMLETAWLSLMMQHVPGEVLVMDAETLRLIHANEAACHRLDCDTSDIAALRLENVFPGLSEQCIKRALKELDHDSTAEIDLPEQCGSNNEAAYPARLRLLRAPSKTGALLIAIGTPSCATSDAALSDSPLEAVVFGMPGLIFRLVLNAGGTYGFHYLSSGCESVLGISSGALREGGGRLEPLLLPEDRPTFAASMQASAAALSAGTGRGESG